MKVVKSTPAVALTIVLVCALLPINGHSEDIPAHGPIPFTVYDKDSNGLISEEEFNAVRKVRLSTGVAETTTIKNTAAGDDLRQLVSMPEQARNLMRIDMLANLSILSAIIGYLAANDFEAAANAAETEMGKSAMGKHRGSGFAPGRFMTDEMRNLGWGTHEAASAFSTVAKQGDMKNSLMALTKVTSMCAACHYSYRTR